MMRERSVCHQVSTLLGDPDARVRREAVMYLAINGNRETLNHLIETLNDADWTVRQAGIIALRTATHLKLPYRAEARASVRTPQIEEIKSTLSKLDWDTHISTLIKTAEDTQLEYAERCDAIRAICRTGEANDELVRRIIKLVKPHETKSYYLTGKSAQKVMYQSGGANATTRPPKQFVGACIRAIGRLSQAGKQGESYLISLLDYPHWADQALDAMLDCGGPASIDAVIRHLPDYGFNPSTRHEQHTSYQHIVKSYPASDNPQLCMSDRLPKLYYQGLRVLCQRPLLERHRTAIRAIAPTILATIPNHFDSTVVYSREPLHDMTAYLLEFSGTRKHALDAAWAVIRKDRHLPESFEHKDSFMKLASDYFNTNKTTHPPYASQILAALARESDQIPHLIELLDHPNGWLRIDACRALIFLNAKQAAPKLRSLLTHSPDDATFGVRVDLDRFKLKPIEKQGYDEFCDPSPRFKYAWIIALEKLGDDRDIPLLQHLSTNDQNVLEVQHAAVRALASKSNSGAHRFLQTIERDHPYYSIRLLAREALYRSGTPRLRPTATKKASNPHNKPSSHASDQAGLSYAFIKGPHDTGNHFQISKDQTAYSTTDSGPTYRFGHNVYIYDTHGQHGKLKQLTHFNNAYVADLEVSYDGQWLLFCKRNIDSPDPWWHLFEIHTDGSKLRQITHGPYHDVQPVYLPDDSIAFSSTRLGYRDEYHGYPSTGLTTVNRDGTNIQVVGFNFGRDSEPSVGKDGKILFTRLELFYSRVKTEWTLMSAFPDGSKAQTLYGPERRELFYSIKGAQALSPPRHRVLRITQPQPFGNNQYIINSFRGPMLVGPGREQERFLLPNNHWAVTCPYPLDDQTLLVSAGKRPNPKNLMQAVNHGIYHMNVDDGSLKLIYDDPATSELDARPLRSRPRENILTANPTQQASTPYTGVMICNSVFNSRQQQISDRTKYIRINEGIPVVERHQTHTNHGAAWRNHGGPIGRILGTIPVARDGSFSIEIPADRLVHFQALDSDRQVIGNEINWQYVRPGDNLSCIGCHEKPDTTPVVQHFPLALRNKPVRLLPSDDDILYRAKMWFKGWAPDEREARMRSVNAINTYGRE